MKVVIQRAGDGAIVAALDDPAAAVLGDFPTLARGTYAEITDQEFTDLTNGTIFDSYAIPKFEIVGGVVTARAPQARYWFVVDQNDNIQGAVWSHRGRTPKHPPNLRLVECDKATHDQVDGENQFFPDSALPRWSVDGSDNVIENTDTRFNLEVAASETEIASGDPVTLTLTLKNSDGATVNFNGSRQMHVQHIHDSVVDQKQVRLTFSAGVATVPNRVLAEGTWAIISHDANLYRVSGDTSIHVAEAW